jgi:hypothetical protein
MSMAIVLSYRIGNARRDATLRILVRSASKGRDLEEGGNPKEGLHMLRAGDVGLAANAAKR